MKKLLILSLIVTSMFAQEMPDYLISPVDIKKVKIHDDFWLPKIEVVQSSTIDYAINKCEKEGRMDNFLVAGGALNDTIKGKMPFDDTDLYKIIEGASYSLISHPDKKLDSKIDSLIEIISIGQEDDGYLTTWFTVDRQNPPAAWVKPSTERWEHLEASHELYNSGHMFEAAAAHYWATGKRNFLDIAIKNADLLVKSFGPGKLQVPPGHQIVETGLIKLYHITHNQDYLDLAKFYLEARGDSTTHKLYGDYSQDHMHVLEQDEAVGHAVRAVYMYAGMTDIAAIYKDKDYLNAINKIWESAYNRKMYITGGIGSHHGGEAFGVDYELPNLKGYNETCAAIGNIYWNHRLFLLTGNSKYYDIIERNLYNGMISGISLDGKKFFYPNPTESDGEYKFNMGACTRQNWFDCSCCPTNLIRFIPSIPGLIYAAESDTLFVNLFSTNNATVNLGDKKLDVAIESGYPWKGDIKIILNPETASTFTVKIRIPGWAVNKPVPGDLYSYILPESKEIQLKVNNENIPLEIDKGYAVITREWNKDDSVELVLPLDVKKVEANKNVKDDRGKVAFEYGPIVYCAEEVENKDISDIIIPKDIKLNPTDRKIITDRFMALESNIDGKELKLIPYYLWSNRGAGKMKVWFPMAD